MLFHPSESATFPPWRTKGKGNEQDIKNYRVRGGGDFRVRLSPVNLAQKGRDLYLGTKASRQGALLERKRKKQGGGVRGKPYEIWYHCFFGGANYAAYQVSRVMCSIIEQRFPPNRVLCFPVPSGWLSIYINSPRITRSIPVRPFFPVAHTRQKPRILNNLPTQVGR